ncbi:MAG: histidine phosphatase family protein [Chloroflexi bacterium]|nr:histidine phosphatase family protein [Chloroflexota bacterium]MBU1660146.1 histidine phosphatase family protein [Chloroflexota bacterium]
MKTLLILRHAKSSWKDTNLADHDRPLKERGQRDASRMGSLIQDEDLIPDLILSSTAKRTRDTAELVAEACGYDGKIKFQRDLYNAWTSHLIEILRDLKPKHTCVMIVGHNPGLEELLYVLTDKEEWLPTAALAQIQLPIDRWNKLEDETEGKLVNLWRPRELG